MQESGASKVHVVFSTPTRIGCKKCSQVSWLYVQGFCEGVMEMGGEIVEIRRSQHTSQVMSYDEYIKRAKEY